MNALVDGGWLQEHLDDPELRIIESTSYLDPHPTKPYEVRSGRADWEAGHIPRSVYLDVNDDLAEPHETLNFTFPSAERFAAAMSRAGVEDGTRVVIYDRGGPMWATRVWWLLRAYGFDDAAVLDGGWDSWTGPVSTDPAPEYDAHFVPRPRPELIADRGEVLAQVSSGGAVCLLNALSPAVHAGRENRYGRVGRIPGSVNVYAQHLLDPETRRFLPPDVLREKLAAVGALRDERVIAYCGGGISATVDAFALTLLGARDVAVYDGSMREWLSDPALPVEVD
jgi:thiosulfate/3-mercaptopyruvate sulfurtransferase